MGKRVPPYAIDPLKTFLEYLETSSKLLDLSIRAISMTQATPRMVEAIAMVERSNPDWNEQRHIAGLERAKQDAEFAENECETGFPLLHEFTLVGVWGAFEAAIEDVVLGILRHEPDLLRADVFAKTRIPLADFQSLDEEGRMRVLLTEVQRNLRCDQKCGVAGFESILDAVGLAGKIDAQIKDAIWEMSHIRNVIVHRASRADRNFVANCPKLGLNIGDRIPITQERLDHYRGAVSAYVTALVYRMGARYGVDMRPLPDVHPPATSSQ